MSGSCGWRQLRLAAAAVYFTVGLLRPILYMTEKYGSEQT
jgi:hypothetical protein